MKDPIVPFDQFSTDSVVTELDAILDINPHRHEMRLLDGILYLDEEKAVGFRDVKDDEFWVRGHFPGRPLMPGVLICECAAQLSSFFAVKSGMVDDNGVVGLGGLEDVRFRGPVSPGDQLIVMLRRGKVRRNRMFTADFQGFVKESIVVQGVIRGVNLDA